MIARSDLPLITNESTRPSRVRCNRYGFGNTCVLNLDMPRETNTVLIYISQDDVQKFSVEDSEAVSKYHVLKLENIYILFEYKGQLDDSLHLLQKV